METTQCPSWAQMKTPNEGEFCQYFYLQHPLSFFSGKFYDQGGMIRDEGLLKQEIYWMIKPYYKTGLQNKVDNLFGALRMEMQTKALYQSETQIHVANGTVQIGGEFSDLKYICPYRLPVKYDPNLPKPDRWLKFLQDLLDPEDILTLQEYLGYCLIPCTMAQKMLMIIGEGGEGKSRIGVVMKAILGEGMSNGSISKVEHNPFARADLQNILLMVDDDLKLSALNSTNYIKSIITADTPMDLERKGEQSFQGVLHCRFLAFGNGALEALHDRSYGFFRRQIILTAKPRDPDRVDDPFLGTHLAREADSIFLWCLEGLERLIINNFKFTISEKTKRNWENVVNDSNNVVEFFRSEGYFQFDEKECTASRLLYEAYVDWCKDNVMRPLSGKSFWQYLGGNHHKYGLIPTNNIYIGNGKRARGFYGIRILPRF